MIPFTHPMDPLTHSIVLEYLYQEDIGDPVTCIVHICQQESQVVNICS